jgi:hypothetical protein
VTTRVRAVLRRTVGRGLFNMRCSTGRKRDRDCACATEWQWALRCFDMSVLATIGAARLQAMAQLFNLFFCK